MSNPTYSNNNLAQNESISKYLIADNFRGGSVTQNQTTSLKSLIYKYHQIDLPLKGASSGDSKIRSRL
jgi:hypothetical protein